MVFLLFLILFLFFFGEKGRVASPRCWGRLRRRGSLAYARHQDYLTARRERLSF